MAPNINSVQCIDKENVGLPDIDNVNVCAASNPAVVVDKLKEQVLRHERAK